MAKKFKCYLCLEYSDIEKNTLKSYVVPDQYEEAVGITDHAYFRKWVSCGNCGLKQSLHSRSNNALDVLYENLYRKPSAVPWRKYTNEETFELVKNLPPESSETIERVSFIKARICNYQMMGFFPHKSNYRLLDVGGATGSFAFEFKNKDWEVFVVDPDPSGNFLEKYGINFRCGYLNELESNDQFDLVSLIFVLEHIEDPKIILEEVSKLMCQEGLLYIEVPDEIAFEKKGLDDDIFNSCHLFLFGSIQLVTLLDKCGFEILSLERSQTKRGHLALSCLAKLKS